MSSKLQRWINSPWWDDLDKPTKFFYLLFASVAIAGTVFAIVDAITG
jgi:hypothetical protein